MATEKTPDGLFLDILKDLSYAGKQIAKSLPKMAKPAQPHDLRAGIEQHLEEIEVHVRKLGTLAVSHVNLKAV